MVGGYVTRRNVEILGSEIDVIGVLPKSVSKETDKLPEHQPERIVIECKDWREGEYVREETIWRTVCLADQWNAHPFLAISDCDLTNGAKNLSAKHQVGILRDGKIRNKTDFFVFEKPKCRATQLRPNGRDQVRQFRKCWKHWPFKDDC